MNHEDLNEYKPWLELGISEREYWKRRYIEGRTEISRLEAILASAEETLALIASPMRPDGSWNRDRNACREMAERELKKMREAK